MEISDDRVCPMTDAPNGFNLPPRDITPPTNVLWSTARIYIPGVILLLVVTAVLDRHSAGVVGAAVSIAVLVLILGIELPLIRRSQKRRQEAMTATLPPGGIYAGFGGLFRTDAPRRHADSGTVVIDQFGITFQPKKDDVEKVSIPWIEINHLQLGSSPGKIGVGRLVVGLETGINRVFSIPRFGPLAEVLGSHP